MRILYLGSASGTSGHRAEAIRRLGHRVALLDPRSLLSRSRWVDRWIWRAGGVLLEPLVRRGVMGRLAGSRFQLVLVNCGELVGPAVVRELRGRFGPVVNYNNDDPFGTRDGDRWRLYLSAVPEYDLVVVVRHVNVGEARARGAGKVLRVFRSADEVAHAPRRLSDEDRARWGHDVLFAGTWMPERGPLLAGRIELGVPLTIYGNRWQKAREWALLRRAWKGPALEGDDYAKAIQGAKACLGLVSKGNRDEHTTRSMEIPFLGGVLCAERTREHFALYREGEEAVFWDGAKECAGLCHRLLKDADLRQAIARRGRERCFANGHLNERVMARVLEAGTR